MKTFHDKLEWLKTTKYSKGSNYWEVYDEVEDALSKSLKRGPVTSDLCDPKNFDPYMSFVEVVVEIEGKFYRFSYCLQSWGEYERFGGCDVIGDIVEVVPVERVVTVYEPRT